MTTGESALVIPFRRSVFALVLLVLLGFTVGSIWLVVTPLPAMAMPAWFVRASGCSFFVIYGACSLYVVRMMRRPALTIDGDGIIINQLDMHAFSPILWRDTSGLRMVTFGPLRLIIIRLRDRRQFIDRGNLFQRCLKRMSLPLPGLMCLDNFTYGGNFDELMVSLRRYFDQAGGDRISPR